MMGNTLRVQSCCCGNNLRTGTMIIGSVDLIGALVTIVFSSIAIVHSVYYDHDGWEDYYNRPMRELRPMYITMAVCSFILLIIDCFLIFGVSKAKPRLILPWIFYAFFSLLLNFICGIIYGDYSFAYHSDTHGYVSISWAIFYLAFKLYFLLVVWSYYLQLIGSPATTLNNGVPVIMYLTVPIGQQPFPNTTQTYANMQTQYSNVQTQYPNVQMQYPDQPPPYPNAQQPYPEVQVQQTFPNPQQPYPNPQQTYPNSQQSYSNPQQAYPNSQQPYPNPQQPNPNPQQLTSMESMKRKM